MGSVLFNFAYFAIDGNIVSCKYDERSKGEIVHDSWLLHIIKHNINPHVKRNMNPRIFNNDDILIWILKCNLDLQI